MRFQNNTIHKEIDQAIMLVESLLIPDSELDKAVYQKNDWKFDKIKEGRSVCIKLIDTKKKPIQVFTYKPFNPFTKAIGYFDGKAIHINSRKLPFMTTVEIAANLLHEYAHYCGYTHGNNFKTQEKCHYSVPYYLSENISKWL